MWPLLLLGLLALIGPRPAAFAMDALERSQLREEARDMFYHAYRAYMENAYPADELMPLSCKGRVRGQEPSRGDIDDSLGNFSLTLVDTLDTLAVLGDFEEFEHGVKLVIRDVTFDTDLVVSVFETNIRMLGGLLSAHILAEYFQQRAGIMSWYRGELLSMAKDLGFRLLPAFNTTTGIPHGRINLRHGMRSLENLRETCTACAGTMVLEMAALSRLSGEPVFEEKAHRAMDVLWQMRHRSSDLMGTVLNIHSGDWVRRDSGVGAGIDSYYEYCLKAYILLGEEKYLGRFNRHYDAVMKYISQGPLLLDVLMHRPHTNSRNFMDALLAFWPGLQVLKGDIRPAVETHEMLYQVIQRHNLLPEAFTTDFQVHWGQHPLRPEFLESTYFLYRATQDPYYLQVGKHALQALQKYARVPCGYAAVKDVRTAAHEDRMDSFVLAETFKYLFLLFAEPADLVLDLDEFIFTTEAHLLPLSLSTSGNASAAHLNPSALKVAPPIEPTAQNGHDPDEPRTCPSTLHLFPESVRRPLKNMVNGMCPRRSHRRKLHAVQFQVGNPEHMKAVRDMGIAIITLPDGRLQLLHTFANARSASDAEEGLQFMQEMVELSKAQAQAPDSTPLTVSYRVAASAHTPAHKVVLTAGPAHFGRELKGNERVVASVALAEPLRVCAALEQPQKLKGRIAVIERGDCMFIDKARRVEAAGAVGAIVLDNTGGSSSSTSSMFAMSGDGTNDVHIPVVFLFQQDALQLLQAVSLDPELEVTLQDSKNSASSDPLLAEAAEAMDARLLDSILDRLKGSVNDFLSKQHDQTKVNSIEEGDDEDGHIRTKRGRSRNLDPDGPSEEPKSTKEPKEEL
ncbi:ER degradation-enhancing alpha-mannosidase-like protein 3 isoform X2 [Cloeon dipterum]|uniref:ER degradation-enhancing alpha-mannosidase-like protein 3 isoform X2 n=1 Tax=Cloeon dipterum TaxID=197152 RepID=UPI0032205AA3